MNKVLIAGALVLSVPAAALAGSISLPDFSSKAGGRATAVTAVADSPSALFYNPANIALLPGLQLDVGIEALMPRFQWRPVQGDSGVETKSDVSVSTPPFASLSYNFGDVGVGDLALGLGFGVSHGSAFAWPEDWAGNQEVQDISLMVFELTPALAWRPHKMVALAAGFRYMPSTVYMKRAVGFGTEAVGSVELAGTATAYGASAGLTVLPTDELTFGVGWRSATTLEFDGKSNFEMPPPFDTEEADGTGRAEIPTAQVLRAGVNYELSDRFELSGDFEVEFWSKYEALKLTLVDAAGNETPADSPRNSKDSYVIHLGGEYDLSDAVTVRGGWAYDRRTLPQNTVNPAPPDSDRQSISLGATYVLGDLGPVKDAGVSFNFSNVLFAKRSAYTSPFRGEWSGGWPLGTAVYIFGLGITGSIDAGGASAFADAAPAPEATPTTSTTVE